MKLLRSQPFINPIASFGALFLKNKKHSDLGESIKDYLAQNCRYLSQKNTTSEQLETFWEHLQTLLNAEQPAIQQAAVQWIIEDFIHRHLIPRALRERMFAAIRKFRNSWVALPLNKWLSTADGVYQDELVTWLAELEYSSVETKTLVVNSLLQKYFVAKMIDPAIESALLVLDEEEGVATDRVLFQFPSKLKEQNLRMIALLGRSARVRVVKPLIGFAKECPEYLPAVVKALRLFELDEVNQFYLDCLAPAFYTKANVFIEAIKQVRQRRLRKGMPLLESAFPVDANPVSIINRAINGQIAITLASFGSYIWARDKMIPAMLLEGIHTKYLKAVDMLDLEEAVPLLKALILAPENPDLLVLQQKAYQICARLLAKNREVVQNINLKPIE